MRSPLEFRDPARAQRLLHALSRLTRDREADPITVMHVCGSHEQAVARFGLRAVLPPGLDLIMGPGCPVCVTDCPEIDEAVALARAGLRFATYGDMLRVPGSGPSLGDAAAEGARVDVVYSVSEAAELARSCGEEIGETLALYERLIELAAQDDPLLADLHSEIEAAGRPPGRSDEESA